MSLRSGKSRRPSSSITVRLAVFYTLTTLCILFVSSTLLYWMLSKSFTRASTEFLNNEAMAIANVLRSHVNDWSALNQEVIWKPQSQGNHYYAKVSTSNGQPVRETFGLSEIIMSGIKWPKVKKENNATSPVTLVKTSDNQYYMLISSWISLKNSKKQSFLIQVALNVSHDQQLLWLYRQNLLFVTIFGTLCALLLSLLLSKLGLRPLRRLTREISKMSVAQLSDRLSYNKPPKELSDLIVAFNMALDRIEDSFERLSSFSSDIAHELRTPINNLRGETEVLLSRPREPAEYESLLVSNLEEYEHLSRIVDRLLFIARADNNNINLAKEKLQLKKEVLAVLEFLEAYAEEKAINIELVGNATIEADSTLIRNALTNLITNAIKYSQRHSKIKISIKKTKQEVYIIIADTGPGIDNKHLSHIFDRFYRVDSDRAKNSGGSGLGLAIVKSIIELHNGVIDIESELGNGTTINIMIPTVVIADHS